MQEVQSTPPQVAPLASMLGVTAPSVLRRLDGLYRTAVAAAGVGTLAAMAVPRDRVEALATVLAGYDEVTVMREPSCRYNLWFAVAAAGEERVRTILSEVACRTGLAVLHLPLDAEAAAGQGSRHAATWH